MTHRAHELLQKALQLTDSERAELAGSLIESLDPTLDADLESAWQQEVARRIADLDSGKARTIPWDKVRSKLAFRSRHDFEKS